MYLHALIIMVAFLVPYSLSANEANEASVKAITEAMKHDLNEAEDLVVNALKSAPENAEINFLCGRIMGQQAEDSFISALSYATKSLNCLKKAVELAPKNIDYRMGLIRFYLGAPGIAGGDEKLAKKQVEEIYQISRLHGLKAELLYLTEIEETEAYFALLKQAVSEFPNASEFHYRLGLQFQQQEKYTDAHNSFTKAAALTEESDLKYSLNALYQVGRNAVFSEMNLEQGVKALKQFIQIGQTSSDLPPLAWAHLRLAQLAKLMNEPLMMEQHLKSAMSSDDKELHRIVRQLKRQTEEAA